MRRLVMILALLSSSVVALVAPAPVHADVVAVEPEPIARIWAAPTSPQTTGPLSLAPPQNQVPWGIDRLDQRATEGDNSFSFSNSGSNVDVYIVDTGINSTHPEFDARVSDGWSYRANSTALTSYKTALSDYLSDPNYGIRRCPSNSNTQQFSPATYDAPISIDTSDKGKIDNNGHGTHVAGTIGGNYTGVAKAVNLYPVRVLDSCGSGTREMISGGLSWIKSHHQIGKAAVVNLSLGFSGQVDEIDALISDLLLEGIVVVAAAGNITPGDNTDLGEACGTTPAGTLGTISVGASNELDGEAAFSYYGDCVDMFAPGQSILSTWPKYTSINTYIDESGTSMAAPHVAGAAARYLQGKTVSSSTPAETWGWLKLNATCNAISYYAPTNAQPSRENRPKTPNRLLAVGAPVTAPCAPEMITATAGTRTLNVSWNPVAADNGSATLSYTVTLSPGNQTCTRTPLQTLSCSFSELLNGTTYTASVQAKNELLIDGVAATATATTSSGVPGAVTSVAGTVNGNSLVVSWVRGLSDGDGVTYTATAMPGGTKCTSTSNSCPISGLTVGVEYTITVVGVNTTGTGMETSIVKTFARVPLAVTALTAISADHALAISWEQGSGEGTGVTYTATATPGDLTCTSTSNSCSIAALTNGVEYSISVAGANKYGTGSSTTIKGTPDGVAEISAKITSVVNKRTVTLSWPAVPSAANITYVVSSQPGALMCTTTLTSCEVTGLSYGVVYSFVITTRSPTGLTSSATLANSVRPGFKVKKTTVKRGSATLVTSFMSSISAGKKTWSETGPCSMRGKRLLAPKKVTSCVLVLKVAKKGIYPAMSTRLKVSIK